MCYGGNVHSQINCIQNVAKVKKFNAKVLYLHNSSPGMSSVRCSPLFCEDGKLTDAF